MKPKFMCSIIIAFLLALSSIASHSYAEDGVTREAVIIGMTGNMSSLTMPEETLGIKLYLKEINDKGGVNGRKFEFIEYDDKNDIKLTEENLIKLIEKDKIFAIHFV